MWRHSLHSLFSKRHPASPTAYISWCVSSFTILWYLNLLLKPITGQFNLAIQWQTLSLSLSLLPPTPSMLPVFYSPQTLKLSKNQRNLFRTKNYSCFQMPSKHKRRIQSINMGPHFRLQSLPPKTNVTRFEDVLSEPGVCVFVLFWGKIATLLW